MVAIPVAVVGMLVPGLILFVGYRLRSVVSKVVAGLVATAVMVLELWVAVYLAGVGSATSGSQAAYSVVRIVALVFLGALVVYVIACVPQKDDDDSNHHSRGSQ